MKKQEETLTKKEPNCDLEKAEKDNFKREKTKQKRDFKSPGLIIF